MGRGLTERDGTVPLDPSTTEKAHMPSDDFAVIRERLEMLRRAWNDPAVLEERARVLRARWAREDAREDARDPGYGPGSRQQLSG